MQPIDNAKIKICGTARFSKGTNLKLFANSELFIGDKFTSNANLIISCAKYSNRAPLTMLYEFHKNKFEIAISNQ